jgi:hypothetical protein
MIRCLKRNNVTFFTHIGHFLNSVYAYADNKACSLDLLILYLAIKNTSADDTQRNKT